MGLSASTTAYLLRHLSNNPPCLQMLLLDEIIRDDANERYLLVDHACEYADSTAELRPERITKSSSAHQVCLRQPWMIQL